MIELLAVTDDPRPPAPPVRAVRSDAITILYVAAEDSELGADDLWRREEQLETLMEERTLLPVRIGTRVADERAAVAAVAELGPALVRRIDHVRGAVELAVRARRIEADSAPDLPSPGGRAYLEHRAERERAAQAAHAPLAAISRDARLTDTPQGLRGAYLVDRDRVDEFVARVKRLQRERPELDLLCTGPWPPYSFAAP